MTDVYVPCTESGRWRSHLWQTTVFEKLAGARLIIADPEGGVFYAWPGGHTVNVYDVTGAELDQFSAGNFQYNEADEGAIRAAIAEDMEESTRERA